jgi:hypothetical protein
MDQAPLPVGLVVFPPALIEGAVGPHLDALPLSDCGT